MALRRVGLTAAAGVVLVFSVVSLVVIPVSALVALGEGLFLGLIVFAVARGPSAALAPGLRRRALVAGRNAGGAVALAVLFLTGSAAALGLPTTPVPLLAAAAATPWLLRRRTRPIEPDRSPAEPAGAPSTESATTGTTGTTGTEELVSLSTMALCARWQTGYYALRRHPSPRLLDAILRTRRECLDELERRDAAGVARWLAAESRPGSTSPHRYLSVHAPPTPATRPESPADTDTAEPLARPAGTEPTTQHGESATTDIDRKNPS